MESDRKDVVPTYQSVVTLTVEYKYYITSNHILTTMLKVYQFPYNVHWQIFFSKQPTQTWQLSVVRTVGSTDINSIPNVLANHVLHVCVHNKCKISLFHVPKTCTLDLQKRTYLPSKVHVILIAVLLQTWCVQWARHLYEEMEQHRSFKIKLVGLHLAQ